MINQQYKKMLEGKSVIRELSEFAAARGGEIGYENVFDYSLGNPSVPAPERFAQVMTDLLKNKGSMEQQKLHGASRLQPKPWNCFRERKDCGFPE